MLLQKVYQARKDFPIFSRKVNGRPLVYLDSAATSQKPLQVLNILDDYYRTYNANVHRGIHKLSEEATEKYEAARGKVANFVKAGSEEIIFVRNATEGINLVFYSWALQNLKKGDEVVLSVMEHHSNLVPWQQLQAKGVKLRFADIDKEGRLRMDQLQKEITKKTKLVTITHASNVLGTINPVKEIGKLAHENGSVFMVDACQSVPHFPVNVNDIDADFLAFSGHKMCGPTGIGVLYGKKGLLEKMQPFLFGGDMIKEVKLMETVFNDLPYKFEAGTPYVAGVIGLGAAIDYLSRLGMDTIFSHEKELIAYALDNLANINQVKIYGPKTERVGAISFNIEGIHSHDVATIMDQNGIAVRSGHACAQPLMERLGVDSVTRASLYLYNNKEDIDALADGVKTCKKIFRIK